MNGIEIRFAGLRLTALGSGALYWPEEGLLVVADLHLGKSERMARRRGVMLPPYEVTETLSRLAQDVAATGAEEVLCLGDSFDDLAAAQALRDEDAESLAALQAGRQWWWIEGNHDPGPLALGGTHLAEMRRGPLRFVHIAEQNPSGEVSGHWHPKLALPGCAARRAFLFDEHRLILPAYGAYTGGMRPDQPPLSGLLNPGALAVLTGPRPVLAPLQAPVRRGGAGRARLARR
ncbi:ligase-associated DNA damage response endonuclease PdeM [Pseudoroseicyclus aestuarii]|uniref:Putative phosphoesterase n=1 Tax=Pseudoroseicyclus aestuarii TaxID=1795041 RepID=A0A318SYA3_9RHOB|nr:ligase-associated DNA damage response endonuclease PdeM [Pseudoroseicyclus aestuarii]PYE85389.1 putative phosphoesterase [Pseudoroseicyclus aestuarii]